MLGSAASLFLVGNILLPMSPGALSGLEYGVSLALLAAGAALYRFRDTSVSGAEQERLIFGDMLRRKRG